MFDLTGHTVLVTGASSGIGKHFAKVCASHGASVVIAARRKDKLEETAAEIAASGRNAVVVEMDVANAASITAAIAAAERTTGVIDILINNAGIVGTTSALDMQEQEWDAVVDTNLRGAWLCAREVARRLVAAQKPGAILNVASVLGLATQRGTAPYSASKAGLIHLTHILAAEWVRHGIRVNALAPGYITTDMADTFFTTPFGEKVMKSIPMRRVGTAYMTGSVLAVDGGFMLGGL
jgi:NAD(P)-dependent dehydrogenase (short-subunit alcohol dehydrogenase family)